jgi:hypothetical protein
MRRGNGSPENEFVDGLGLAGARSFDTSALTLAIGKEAF